MTLRPLRLAVTGRDGQVATALARRASAHGVTVVHLGRPLLDLEAPGTIAAAIAASKPDVVVNAAAYTAVDKAEAEPARAFAINAAGAEAVAGAARELGVPVVQISTDYVFAGIGDLPHREIDPVAPTGVYGASKLDGEQRVAAANPNHAILRTSWVHAPWGMNFIRSMLRLAKTRDELGVVGDQHGAPTSAVDIADGIVAVARNLVDRPDDARLRGLFHMTSAGATTWAGFAEAIFAASRDAGGPSARVRPITTADYPTPARRPANSRLSCFKLAKCHGVALPPWTASIPASVLGLLAILEPETSPR